MYTPSAYAFANNNNNNAIRSASSQVYPQGLRDPRLIHPPLQHQQPLSSTQTPYGLAIMSPGPQQLISTTQSGYQTRPVYVVPQQHQQLKTPLGMQQPNPYQLNQTNPFQMNQPVNSNNNYSSMNGNGGYPINSNVNQNGDVAQERGKQQN